MLQRLVIVGFIQWISHPGHRLLFGFIFSVAYLAALLAVRPVRLTSSAPSHAFFVT